MFEPGMFHLMKSKQRLPCLVIDLHYISLCETTVFSIPAVTNL